MKIYNKIIFAFYFLLIVAPCTAQDMSKGEIFTTVKSSFEKMYPGAEVIEWELEKNNIYEVEFNYNSLKYEADYAEDGTWICTEREIGINEIPAVVSENLKKSEWSSWQIDEVEELSSPGQDKYYEIELEQASNKLYLYYLPNGSLIEKAAKSKF